MESFEQLCRVALEAEGFAVSGNVKFPYRRKTKKQSRTERQTHGYEVDLVGARSDKLVLAEVKSYFGSRGVSRQGFRRLASSSGKSKVSLFKLFNDGRLRRSVLRKACSIYGYDPSEVELRLYVGKFASGHEEDVRDHLATYADPPVRVVDLDEVVDSLLKLAGPKTYVDDPVVMTVKALAASGHLAEDE